LAMVLEDHVWEVLTIWGAWAEAWEVVLWEEAWVEDL